MSVQAANPAAADVHPRGLQVPLVADEMFAATSPSLFMRDFSWAISQVPLPRQNSQLAVVPLILMAPGLLVRADSFE